MKTQEYDIQIKPHAIIVDIDNTLYNINHRLPYILNDDPPNWKKFNNEIMEDTLNDWCFELIQSMKKKYEILLITGRPKEETIRFTQQRLLKDKVPYSVIYYRESDDKRESSLVKQEIYINHIQLQYHVLFAIDDNPNNCRMYHNLGIPTLFVFNDLYDKFGEIQKETGGH